MINQKSVEACSGTNRGKTSMMDLTWNAWACRVSGVPELPIPPCFSKPSSLPACRLSLAQRSCQSLQHLSPSHILLLKYNISKLWTNATNSFSFTTSTVAAWSLHYMGGGEGWEEQLVSPASSQRRSKRCLLEQSSWRLQVLVFPAQQGFTTWTL